MSAEDYRHTLRQALEDEKDDKALAAFRVLDTTGRLDTLPAELLARLAEVLQRQRLFLEAASVLRLAAQKKDEATENAAGWLLQAACLLLGPAARPEMGRGLLGQLAADPSPGKAATTARHLLILIDTNNRQGLRRFFEQRGLEPPVEFADGEAPPATAGGPRVTAAARSSVRRQGRSWPARLLPWALLVCLAAWLSGTLLRDRLAGVHEISRKLLDEPRQVKIADPRPLRLRHGDWNLVLWPKFSYHICGLIVHVNTYAMMGLRFQDFYERDLCLVWGDNVSTRAFKAPGTSFTHHGNVCYVRWKGPVGINMTQLSNNHIFTLDDSLRQQLGRLRTGDQVCLAGRLVDVSAVPRRAPAGTMPPAPMRLKTSTTRTDTGNGACEIILVDKLSVLARANRLWRLLAGGGFWGALLLALLWLGGQLLRR